VSFIELISGWETVMVHGQPTIGQGVMASVATRYNIDNNAHIIYYL
jgi:hypothetical protein